MLKHFWLTFLILISAVCLVSLPTSGQATSAKRKYGELKYTLEPVFDRDGLRFLVDLSFKGDASGKTTIVLPNQWGGQQRLYQTVKNLIVSSPSAKILDTAEPHVKIVAHQPNQTLRLQYELVQDFAGNPKTEVRYRSVLQKDYFHWIGHGAWAYPAQDESKPVFVSLRWKNLPKAWTLANSFGANKSRQRFQTTIGDFKQAVFVGGDFRIEPLAVEGKSVYTAVRGSWQFSDAAFAETVRKIVKIEREFWRDSGAPYYLITLLPLEAAPNAISVGGTGLTNSFANFATPNAELDRFKFLLAHEYFHNWNSPKLGRMKEPETLLYWFSEGFTDYYTYLLLLRGGLITLDEYVNHHNRLIREYYFSPARTANNPRVLQEFWSNGDVQKLPYQRGFLLATNWNWLIRSASGGANSLDDVMRDMFRDAQKEKPQLTAELIDKYISRYAKQSISPDVRRHIEDGELIAPDKNAFGSHVQMKMIEVPVFELGLDLEALRTKKIIAGVVDGSAPHRAGLRNGQTVVKRSPIYLGDATKPVEMTIKESENERTIKFFPVSQNTISVPQFKLRPDITDKERAETLRRLGVISSGGD